MQDKTFNEYASDCQWWQLTATHLSLHYKYVIGQSRRDRIDDTGIQLTLKQYQHLFCICYFYYWFYIMMVTSVALLETGNFCGNNSNETASIFVGQTKSNTNIHNCD